MLLSLIHIWRLGVFKKYTRDEQPGETWIITGEGEGRNRDTPIYKVKLKYTYLIPHAQVANCFYVESDAALLPS